VVVLALSPDESVRWWYVKKKGGVRKGPFIPLSAKIETLNLASRLAMCIPYV
jgi:hypothetical protein